MKKLAQIFLLFFFIFFGNIESIYALRGYVNPVLDDSGRYQGALAGRTNDVTHNSTSVTLMWDGKEGTDRSIEAPVEPNACYILGKAYKRSITEYVNVDDNNNEEIRNSDPWLEPGSLFPRVEPDDDPSDEEASTARARFFVKGEERDGDWYEPFWIQDPNRVNAYGWSTNDFARQTGGNLCGFRGNPIQGGGSDNPADYVRADGDGRVWYRNLCESFEGVRTDCNKEFALGKQFGHALFRVTCGFYSTADPQYKEDVERGAIDDGRIPPSDKRRSYQMEPDVMCDPSKANVNDKGERELQIFENGLWIKTWGREISEKKLWKGAFRMVTDPDHTDAGNSFTVHEIFSAPNFNPESKTVKTEFGDIPRNPSELATAVLRIALGVAGGVAFLLMVYGSFRLIFARGDPEQVQQGREVITAAVIGLLVIIFATFILQLVGISILGLDI